MRQCHVVDDSLQGCGIPRLHAGLPRVVLS
jgi:hypothetical protein